MSKKKILFISDSVKRRTGYSTVARNIISRLAATDKYDIAQLGFSDIPTPVGYPITYYSQLKEHKECCNRGPIIEYTARDNPEVKYLTPQLKGDTIVEHDTKGACIKAQNMMQDHYGYDSSYYVIQHFKPDIVIPINDIWGLYNLNHLKNRHCYKFVPYLAIDSDCLFPMLNPPEQRPGLPPIDTIRTIGSANKPIVFTNWAKEVINKTCRIVTNGRELTNIDIIPHGVDTSIWKPLEEAKRKELRQTYFGINDNVFLIGCFLKDTPVLMSDLTYKPIQDIQKGDKIINHLGEEDEVIAPDPKEYNGDIFTINAAGMIEPITATQEHPFWAIKSKKGGKKETIGNIKFNCRATSTDKILSKKGSWISIKELEVKDYISEPIIKKVKDVEEISTVNNYNDKLSRNTLPEKIKIDTEFMRFLGLFVAEGSFGWQYDINNKKQHYSSININLNSNEDSLINFIKNYAQKNLGIDKVNIRKTFRNNENIAHVTIELNGMILANFISSFLIGDKCQTKHLKEWLLYLPIEKQKAFLQGWVEGDGCNTKDGRNITVTTCKEMAIQAGQMLARIGKTYSINTDYYENKLNRNHSIRYRITTWNNPKKQINILIDNNFIYRKIRKITKKEYIGTVYNFEVKKENSYVVIQSAVHNSIARNQPRKRHDAIFMAMRHFIDRNYEKFGRKIMCYMHAPLSDNIGWDLQWLTTYYGLTDRIIFDKNLQPGMGPDEVRMNEIVNCFDVHMLLSNSEGFALPMLETAAAGIPNIVSDYSAHADWGKNTLLMCKIGAYEHEPRTGFIKGIVDVDHTAHQLKLLYDSKKMCREYANRGISLGKKLEWNVVCKQWETLLDNIDVSDFKEDRYSQPDALPEIQNGPTQDFSQLNLVHFPQGS